MSGEDLTREEAEAMSGEALVEALRTGHLSRDLAGKLFRPEIVRLYTGPAQGTAKYSTCVFGWGRWWMPSLFRTETQAWRYVQEVAEKYGATVEVAEEVAENFPPD